jgi:predicted RNA methylase
MKHAVAIDTDVMDVLRRSEVTASLVTLPSGQLDRGLYMRVDKALKAAGGKWDRKAGGHVFARDPREALGLALTTGSIVDERKARQQFFTPAALAEEIVALADVERGALVLEPSAGAGAIAKAAKRAGGIVICVEQDDALADELAKERFAAVITADFLSLDPMRFGPFDAVVMNPPFTNGQDIQHVTHAFQFVRVGGCLISVMGAGVWANRCEAAERFRALVRSNHGSIEALPEDSFKDAGTSVRTVLVTLLKREVR